MTASTDHDTPDHTAAAPVAPAEAVAAAAPSAAPTEGGDRAPRRNDGRNRGRNGGGRNGGRDGGRGAPRPAREAAAPARPQNPVLAQLATLCPVLFGETLKPLKRGIYEDLLAAHPGVLEAETLKAALAQHARSSRYLTVIASGQQRHDLNGQPVEALTPEQVHHALIEVFRRRGARSPDDLRPKLRQRILKAYEASGLPPDEYVQRMLGKDEEVNQLTRDALAEASARAAREDALLRAFDASGKSISEFADMYGLHILDANRSLERARARQAPKA
jgi:sRNA-binding protein